MIFNGSIIKRVTVLPEILRSNAIYAIDTDNNCVDLYIKDQTTGLARKVTSVTAILQEIQTLKDVPNGLAALDSNGYLISPIDAQNADFKSNGNYVWEDLVQPFEVRSTASSNNPSWGVAFGNFQGWLFSKSTMNQVWVDFHIKHDYAVGTAMFPHIHWLPTDDTAGTVRWGIEYSYAKGHGQAKFPLTSGTVYVEHNFPANSGSAHFVSEVANGIILPEFETDGVLKIRFFRDAAHVNDTYNNTVHAWQGDIHYQRGQMGTRNKAPGFFTP